MTTDYNLVNQAILDGRDIDEQAVTKDDGFYEYLFNNRVAYYYASQLSKRGSKTETMILEKGKGFEEQYERSLKLIARICKREGFEYLLYKTHRYVPEVVDGDIDLMVRRADFNRFLEAFKREGFYTEEDEPGKGKCVADGYCVIEPHITVSWRGGGYLDEDFVWADAQKVQAGGKAYPSVSFEVELLALIAKILFEPAYLDLYSLKSFRYFYEQGVHEAKMLEHAVRPELLRPVLAFCKKINDQPTGKLPAFLPEPTFVALWTRNLLRARDVKVYGLHTLYFFYWKYRYALTNKLPFTHYHEW